MFNTIDGKQKYFRFNIIGNGSSFKVVTNMLKIDKDVNNVDNKKLYFIEDHDYSNLIPYMYYENGQIKFVKEIPNCNYLTVILKLSITEQYEYNTYIGDFRITYIDPVNNSIDIPINQVITIQTNRAFNNNDLNDTKIWLELAYDDFTIDTNNDLYSVDDFVNPLWRTDTTYIET